MGKNIKISLVLTSIASGVLATSLAMAGVGNVSNTKHNFSSGGSSPQNHEAGVSQVCVFCHTPHNAGQSRLLWNKASRNDITPAFYRLYTSSSTLSNATKAAALTANSPSLLCLGCHDGKTAMNVLHSSGAGTDASVDGYPAGTKYISGSIPIPMEGPITGFFDEVLSNANLGRTAGDSTAGYNLTDDHPIGFSYSAVLSEPIPAARLFSIVQVAAKSSNRIKFSGPTSMVECTTCHDPHVDTSPSGNPAQAPFLVMSNAGSALCLSCHNK